MESLIAYNIPFHGMKLGMHQFDFQVEKSFFKHFPNSIIEDGKFDIKVVLDKKENMFVIDFSVSGEQFTSCDRCLEIIGLPVSNEQQIVFKFAEEPSEEDEIVYLAKGLRMLNLAKYIHESICFAIPLIKTYDCEFEDPSPCNTEMLKYLEKPDQSQSDSSSVNPIWDELNKLNKDQ